MTPEEMEACIQTIDQQLAADQVVIEAYISTAGLPTGAEEFIKRCLEDEYGITL